MCLVLNITYTFRDIFMFGKGILVVVAGGICYIKVNSLLILFFFLESIGIYLYFTDITCRTYLSLG